MEIRTLFFDSYALFEIAAGNISYEPYTKNTAIVTTKLNLMELFYGTLVKRGRAAADRYYDYLLREMPNVVFVK